MSDITLCSAAMCDIKLTCHRYVATPNPHRQAYADFSVDALVGKQRIWNRMQCSYFISAAETKGNELSGQTQ